MFISMLLLTCAIGAEPPKPSRTEQAVRLVSPVVAVFITAFESAERIGEDMIRGETEWAPASALTAIAIAENAKAEAESVKNSDPTDLSEVTAEVAEILDKCEAATREIKTSKVKFDRTVYNLVFETETRSEGELSFEAPDKQSIDLRGLTIPRGEMSLRNAKRSGKPFRMESGLRESWILTKDEIAAGNGEEKTYQRFQRPTQVPNHQRGYYYFKMGNLTFPFLFDIRADQIRTDWTMTLLSQKEERTVLKAIPRTALLRCSVTECLILIDNKTWQVSAVKYYDPSGNLETVYKLG
jgi:hypothetical protein